MVRHFRWCPKPSENSPSCSKSLAPFPSSQQPLNRTCHGINHQHQIFARLCNLVGKIFHPSIPPISPISWSFPLKTRLTGQFRGNFLQLHCSAMSQLCCHVTQAMETMSFAVGNASNLLWRSTPVTGAVYLLLPKYTYILPSPPQKIWGLSFKPWWWAKTVQIRCGSGSGSRLWRFWRVVIGKQRERLANWQNGTLDFHALQNPMGPMVMYGPFAY